MTIRIEIEPVWRFTKTQDSKSMLVMLDFLNEIRSTGKITRAAGQANMSYRHAWNLIEKWSAFFEAPLVDRRRGRGTTLTPLGDKLVWAGQRLHARLKPQLENLSQELETEINQFLPHSAQTLRVHASHGFAVEKLREILSRDSNIGVDLRYVSNQTSLASLARGDCDLAGMHLPQGELRRRSIAACKDWLSPTQHRVVSFVTREMGLMVKRGNPLKIDTLERLLDPAIRFVNRDAVSGTRLLLEQLLAQRGIDGSSINGYGGVEFTHAAVAAYVASDMADVSFGVEAAAKQFDLDFVRLLTEDYFFVCQRQLLELEAMKRVVEIMKSTEFHQAISVLPGYAVQDAGSIKTVKEVFREEK
ncbi:MAG TPA: substrate-binding domain-containing protein [Steroidobacteraceae bacterium]|jgi:molybdate transport repressor ModE-like protein|nr:substrate-binding domain-containing protein [Steroidobacteraceae bacterium]